MSEHPTPSRQSAKRIAEQVKRSFLNYVDHWQEWIVPMLVAGAIAVASMCCCWLPAIVVLGPVTCGLYACSLVALRGRPVETSVLARGWERLGASAAASIFVTLVSALPVLLLVGVFIAFFAVIAAVLPPPPSGQQHLSQAGVHGDPITTAGETTEEAQLPAEDRPSQEGKVPWTAPQRTEEPPPLVVFLVLLMMFGFYALVFLGAFLCWAWQLWFTTRLLFVYPLLADGNLGFAEAIRRSWSETRTRFWELLLVNLLAQIISMVGMYVMYVGVLFTMPIGLTLVALVYEERFGPSRPAEEDGLAGDE